MFIFCMMLVAVFVGIYSVVAPDNEKEDDR